MRRLRTVKEIFIFSMLKNLKIHEIEAEYGLRIIPVEIIGRRWSFAGDNTDIIPGQSRRIQLDDKSGIVIYNWDNVPIVKQPAVEQEIRKLLVCKQEYQ
jgi:hypothetical protein